MWTQVVGKVRLALDADAQPLVAGDALRVGAGTDDVAHARGRDRSRDRVRLRRPRARPAHDRRRRRQVALEPRSVASFYAATMAALDELGVHVTIFPVPVGGRRGDPVRRGRAASRRTTPHAAHRFWLALVQAHRVMLAVPGAASSARPVPVHFFWGGADLAATRFSGRTAPKHPGGVPNCPDWVQELAYSHEVSSCGFWPDGSAEGSFYSYAYPAARGLRRLAGRARRRVLRPDAGRVPPAVRRGAHRGRSPATLLSFFRARTKPRPSSASGTERSSKPTELDARSTHAAGCS